MLPLKYRVGANYVGKRTYSAFKEALYDVNIPTLLLEFKRIEASLSECQKMLDSLVGLPSALVASDLLKLCLTPSSGEALLMPTGGGAILNTTQAIEPSPMSSFADAITLLTSANELKAAAEAAGGVLANVKIAQGSKISFALGVLNNTYSGIVQNDYLELLSLAFYDDAAGGLAVPADRGAAQVIMKPFINPNPAGAGDDARLDLPASFNAVFNPADGSVREDVTLLKIKTMMDEIMQLLNAVSNSGGLPIAPRVAGYSVALIVDVDASLLAINALMPTDWPGLPGPPDKSVPSGRDGANLFYNLTSISDKELSGNVMRITEAFNSITANIANDTTNITWRVRGNNSLYVLNSEGTSDSIQKVELTPPQALKNLENIGMMRFNTRFVRNLFFITNLTRILRLKLNQVLTQDRGLVVNAHSALAAGVMEYGAYPFNPNEVNSTKYPDGSERFEY
jgi:hypothetical protein